MKLLMPGRNHPLTIIMVLVVLLTALIPMPSSRAASPFSDVDPQRHAWAEPSINLMSSKQILIGYTDGTFRPDQAVSKAEWTMMIYRLFNYYRPNSVGDMAKRLPPFMDVPPSHWASQPISEIYNRSFEYGGYGVDHNGALAFRPDMLLTRLQLANMLYSFFDNKLATGKIGEKEVCTLLTAYRDIPTQIFDDAVSYKNVSDKDGRYTPSGLMKADSNEVYPTLLYKGWDGECAITSDPLSRVQAKALTHLQLTGILTADEAGYFRPEDPVTRAEAVTILDRIYRYLKKNNWLKQYSSLDLEAEGGTAAQPSAPAGQPSSQPSAQPGTAADSNVPFNYNAGSNVITPTPPTGTQGSAQDNTWSNKSVIHVRDYFDEKGVISKDLQALGEIETAVVPKEQNYLTIDLKSREKVDLYVIIDGKIGFVRQEELPLTLSVSGVSTVGLKSQQRKTSMTAVGGMVATLSVQLSKEEPKPAKKR